jgi:hypothetical protein
MTQADLNTMSREQCTEDVRLMARRTALLYHYFVTTLVDNLGKEKAIALTEEAIWRYGEHIGRQVRERVAAMGLPNDPENFGKGDDLPSVGWEDEIIETERGPRSCVTLCPLAETWQELGAEELGRLYCYVDQAKYRAFNPQVRLIHAKNVLDGDPYCEFVKEIDDKDDVA